jgi:predicted RNA-binding Zn-ribbon protein involved in translation (DUF1610 family)
MTDIACPSCGAPVSFRSSLSVSAVCPYCQSLLVRRDVNVEDLGKVAALPPDMTPFQVGTDAYDDDSRITLVGRLRLAWQDGFWNEWFFVSDSGRKGWLAEAQGTYALSYEVEEPLHENTRKAIVRWSESKGRDYVIGQSLTIASKSYSLTDVKKAVCMGCEGELPIVGAVGRRATSFDFMGGPDEFASIEVSRDDLRVFAGRYVEWEQLRASNLRQIEGWS